MAEEKRGKDVCHRRKPDRCEAVAGKQIYYKGRGWTYLCDRHADEVDPKIVDKVHNLSTEAD